MNPLPGFRAFFCISHFYIPSGFFPAFRPCAGTPSGLVPVLSVSSSTCTQSARRGIGASTVPRTVPPSRNAARRAAVSSSATPGPFHAIGHAALFDKRKRQLLQRRRVCDRAGNRRIVLLAVRRHLGRVLRARVQRRRRQAEALQCVLPETGCACSARPET